LRTLERTSNSSDIISMYSSLVWREPLNKVGIACIVALIDLPLLPTKKAPTAAPPIISSSSGWNRDARWPPLRAKPPNTAPQTMMYPMMTSKGTAPKVKNSGTAGAARPDVVVIT
jgi:hypothetical protein